MDEKKQKESETEKMDKELDKSLQKLNESNENQATNIRDDEILPLNKKN